MKDAAWRSGQLDAGRLGRQGLLTQRKGRLDPRLFRLHEGGSRDVPIPIKNETGIQTGCNAPPETDEASSSALAGIKLDSRRQRIVSAPTSAREHQYGNAPRCAYATGDHVVRAE